MDGDGSTIAFLLAVLALILLSAFFNGAKSALIAFRDSKLKKLCEEGDEKALRLQKLLSAPARYLDTCDIMGFSCAVGAAVTGMWYICVLVQVNSSRGFESFQIWADWLFFPAWQSLLFLLICVLLFAFVLYLFGYALPRRAAEHKPEGFAFFCIAPLRFFAALFFPYIWLIRALAGGLSRLFGGAHGSEEEDATEEEIRMMVDVGNEKGVIEESQKDMINNIFEFDDRTAEDVMTHRTDVVAVSLDATISDIIYYAINEGFSRIPVYEEDLDNITGIIYVKDLLCLVGCKSTDDFKLTDFIRPVLYVPESNRCGELFKEFTEKKIHMAVVIDEYGGTSGIVTMEDLLESIVGNIQDEYDDEEAQIQKVGEQVYLLDGSADLEEVSEELGLEIEENEDYDTVGGLLTDLLGRIPDEGETPTVFFQNIEFTVLVAENRRIVKVKAVVHPKSEEDGEQSE